MPTAFNGEDIGDVVVVDLRTGGLVGQHCALVTPHHGVADELDHVGPAVVFDTFTLAFDVFVDVVALLAVKSQLAGRRHHDGLLVTLGVLADVDALAADDGRALGDHHIAGEHTGLFQVVIPQRIGFGIHGLVPVGLFRSQRQDYQGSGSGHGQVQKSGVFHKGTNLAALLFDRL